MKKFCIAIVLSLSLLIFCSCNHESKILGTWHGDGSLDMKAIEAPYEFATQMEFKKDGTLVVTNDEGTFEFTYTMTDDTLSLIGEELGWGVVYTIK